MTTYSWKHRTDRAAAIKAMEPGTPCPGRCRGLPMFATPAAAVAHGYPRWLGELDYDHIVPLILGGDMNGPQRVTHARCNRAAGGALTASRLRPYRTTRPRRPPKPEPRW